MSSIGQKRSAPDSTSPDSTSPDSTSPDSTSPDSTSQPSTKRRKIASKKPRRTLQERIDSAVQDMKTAAEEVPEIPSRGYKRESMLNFLSLLKVTDEVAKLDTQMTLLRQRISLLDDDVETSRASEPIKRRTLAKLRENEAALDEKLKSVAKEYSGYLFDAISTIAPPSLVDFRATIKFGGKLFGTFELNQID